jgi:hypothetical protein
VKKAVAFAGMLNQEQFSALGQLNRQFGFSTHERQGMFGAVDFERERVPALGRSENQVAPPGTQLVVFA